MIKFQFDGDVDYFEIDPVAYAPALGARGLTAYRARLDEVGALDLDDDGLWERLAVRYQLFDPAAVIPVLRRLVERELVHAHAQRYRSAAGKLSTMRRLARGLPQAAEVDDDIVRLRELHRRRPRPQQEFDGARPP